MSITHKDLPEADDSTRSERLFISDDRWYFQTREGETIGPFRFRSEALSGLQHFLDQTKQQSA